MGRCRLLKLISGGERGFTLLETMVALGILSLGITLVGTGVFQTLSVQRYWQDQRVATKDLRHVGYGAVNEGVGKATPKNAIKNDVIAVINHENRGAAVAPVSPVQKKFW